MHRLYRNGESGHLIASVTWAQAIALVTVSQMVEDAMAEARVRSG